MRGTKGGNPKGKRDQLADVMAVRRVRITQLRLRGYTIREIAAALNVNKSTIEVDLKAIREEWKAERLSFMDEAVGEQIAKLDQAERETWEAWERSQQPATATIETVSADGEVEIRTETRPQYGDPRFPTLALSAIKARNELLGLNAATKTEAKVAVEYVPPPSRADVADVLQKLRGRIAPDK
jgi:transposase